MYTHISKDLCKKSVTTDQHLDPPGLCRHHRYNCHV